MHTKCPYFAQLCLHTYWFPSSFLQDYQLPQTCFNLLFPLTHANKLCLLSDSPDPCKARLLCVSIHCFVLHKSLLTEFAEAHKHHSKPRFPSKVCMGSLFSTFGLVYIHFISFCGCMSLYCVSWIRLTVAWSLPLLFMARNRLLKTPRIPITPWDTAKSSSTPTDWEKHIDCSDDWWPLCPKSQRSNNTNVHTAGAYSCNSCLEWYILLRSNTGWL